MAQTVPAGSDQVHRLILILIIIVAFTIGLAPATIVLDGLNWLGFLVAGAELLAISQIFQLKTYATERPRSADYLAAFISAMYAPALLGTCWLIVYGALYGLMWLVRGLLARLGGPATFDPAPVAFYSGAVIVALAGISAVPDAVKTIATQLYPNAAGVEPPFRALPLERRRKLMRNALTWLLASLVVWAILLAVGQLETWFYVGVQVVLLLLSDPLWDLGQKISPSLTEQAAATAVGKLLRAVGYDVTLFPRSGDRAIDPLLLDLDLVAQRKDHGLAVAVKVRSETTDGQIPWTAANNVRCAANAWMLYAATPL